jgi:hypothetical protein
LLLEHRDQLTHFSDLWRRLHASQVDERIAAVLILRLAQPANMAAIRWACVISPCPRIIQQTDVFVDVVAE